MTSRRRDPRKGQLAAIHIAAQQLQLDRDAYEAVLQRITGKTSSGKMTYQERAAVIDELRRLGAPAPKGKRFTPPHNIDTEPMLEKIGALLTELQAPWSYADGIARHMFGIERVAWLRQTRQLRAVIAALDARHRKLQAIKARETDHEQD